MLLIIHDRVLGFICLCVHSFHIKSCKLTPRPSCIEMRDWWHEDRRLHSLKSSQAYICENTLLCPFPALCCSKPEIRSFQKPCTAFRHQLQTEANWGIAMDFRAKQPEHASFIIRSRVEAVPSLHVSLQLS